MIRTYQHILFIVLLSLICGYYLGDFEIFERDQLKMADHGHSVDVTEKNRAHWEYV